MKPTPFEIFNSMAKKNNQSLKLSPLSNVKSGQNGKDGWGEVSIALPNEIIANFVINPDSYVGGLIICDKDEFEKEKVIMESEGE